MIRRLKALICPARSCAVFIGLFAMVAFDAASARAQTCITDVVLVATEQVAAPKLAGYTLAGYWDVAGEGVGTSTKGGASMGLFYKTSTDRTSCLRALCLKASDKNDPGTPAGYARAGMWDSDGGGSRGVCGVNVEGAPIQATTGAWMIGIYKRQREASDTYARVIDSIKLVASDSGSAWTPTDGYEVVGNWDVDRGGAVGSDGSTGSYMTSLAVKFGPGFPQPSATERVTAGAKPATAMTSSVAKASQTVTAPDGRNTTRVTTSAGSLEQINKTQWRELDAKGNPTFLFEELKRDVNTVSLVDKSRNTYLDVALKAKKIKCCGANPSANFDLYDITSYEAGFVRNVSPSAPWLKPNTYYRLQLRSSDAYNLRVWGDGQVGSDQDKDDFAKWLLIPTGDETDEYWLFNKGAKDGRGQVLAHPVNAPKLSQWDFIPADKRQRYKIQPTDNGFFRLIEANSKEAVSTRWHEAAFSWSVSAGDKQQEFKLVEAGAMTKDDSLPRFVFWNFDSPRMKDFFTLQSGMKPEPSVVNIKKFVFVNVSNHRVVPAVHHFGCADAPWRAGNAQCFYASLGPYEQAEFEVNDYVKNAKEIWMIIGSVTAIVVGVAITIACVAACSELTAAWMGPAAATIAGATTTITVGAELSTFVLGAVDLFILGWAPQQIIYSSMDVAKPDEVGVKAIFDDMAMTTKTLPIIRANLGNYSFAARNEAFSATTDGFYLEETVSGQQIKKMFYANGTALILIE